LRLAPDKDPAPTGLQELFIGQSRNVETKKNAEISKMEDRIERLSRFNRNARNILILFVLIVIISILIFQLMTLNQSLQIANTELITQRALSTRLSENLGTTEANYIAESTQARLLATQAYQFEDDLSQLSTSQAFSNISATGVVAENSALSTQMWISEEQAIVARSTASAAIGVEVFIYTMDRTLLARGFSISELVSEDLDLVANTEFIIELRDPSGIFIGSYNIRIDP